MTDFWDEYNKEYVEKYENDPILEAQRNSSPLGQLIMELTEQDNALRKEWMGLTK